jgi:hypothetical protein
MSDCLYPYRERTQLRSYTRTWNSNAHGQSLISPTEFPYVLP